MWSPSSTRAVVGALADPAIRKKFADQSYESAPREQQTPEYLAEFHKAEIEKWWPIIKAAGIKGGLTRATGRLTYAPFDPGSRRRCWSLLPRRVRADVSHQADHHHRAVPGRRADRHAGAHPRRAHEATLGQPVIVENVSGAGRQHRRGAGRPRRARRLHDQHWPLEHPCRARRDL